ncbi:hypothetical protein FJB73_23010, partial [Salmonella enterica subsp. enterica]|nr:hypothetical protein [Salmonella enterica subsp. enterica]
ALYTLVKNKKKFERYNQLAFFKPYPYQLDWIAASKDFHHRYLSAGNRLGKTYGACMELAAQITGLFPDWWPGVKINLDRPGVFWVIGKSQQSTNDSLMKLLLGVSDCRHLAELGTGTIPRECINTFSMDKDGARCLKVRIKHVNGYENVLHFFAATQDEGVFMGQAVDFILMDEQSVWETELFAQCSMRVLTTNGYVHVTCTPEEGASKLWNQFKENKEGDLYFQNTTWNDCPHITEEMKKSILSTVPEWQREMRSKGIPVRGSGAVYPYKDEEIHAKLDLNTILANAYAYKLLWSCDFGYSSNASADPSVLTLLAYHIETDIIYIVEEWNSKQDRFKNRLAHQPAHMASIIKASKFPYAPLICPHDAQKQMDGIGTATTRLAEFKKLGINVLPKVFEIPHQLTTGIFNAPKHPRSLEWTISYMNTLFHDGKLKLDTKKLKETMREFRLYHTKDNGNPSDKDNHHMDSIRYGAVSIKYKGWLATRCLGKGKSNYEEARELNEKLRARQF